MTNHKPNVIELDDNLLNDRALEYTAVIIGRDLSSYLIALILAQHGHRVAIVSRLKAPVLIDLCEYLSLKYLFEAARRLRSMHSLHSKGLEMQFDEITSRFDWQQLTNECKQEFLDTKQKLEKEIVEKDIPIYEGKIVMVEDYIVRVISQGIREKEN
jgi:pyruvate/2-oxoglutarate dehydrogenase complex dihydrolipoamide dehydrogenase (E3) component